MQVGTNVATKYRSEQKGKDAHFSAHGLLHLLSFSQCLPHAGFLPGQEPPAVSGTHSSSPFPSSANISGLGPKSPVFEGKKWSTSVHIRDKITARMRSDS